LLFNNTLAKSPADHPCSALQAVLLKGVQRPPVYIVTDLPIAANVKFGVGTAEYGNVGGKTVSICPGRTATEIIWQLTDIRGNIYPLLYNFCIEARALGTGEPVPIKHFGIAIGYPNLWEATNAIRITNIIPDPVEKKAKIKYSLGLEAVVTMEIIDEHGEVIDNVISKQRRRAGVNEETWKRCKRAESGTYKVKAESVEKAGTAIDFRGFTCK